MKWFGSCTTPDQVKALYKKLAKANHPDFGGSTQVMQAINSEYAYASAKVVRDGGLNRDDAENELHFSRVYQEAIEKISHLEGLIIELIGHWIWVSGNTRPYKEVLKGAGYYFASKKLAWYYRSDEFRVKKGGKKSLEEIRSKYGSERVSAFKTKSKPYLNA